MGSVLSLSSLACCLTGTCVNTTCAVCPKACSHSSLAKLMYALILMVTVFVSCIMLAPDIETWLNQLPFCETADKSGQDQLTLKRISDSLGLPLDTKPPLWLPCSDFVGYLAVYRICFVVTLFFSLMAVLMIGVRSSRDPRASLQNGFWGFKFLILFGGVVGAFFIPRGGFGQVWMRFGLTGGFLFVLVQLVLIVDFAHTWAETWQENYRSTSDSSWFWALLSATGFMFSLTLVGVVLGYIFYTGNAIGRCPLHEFFITFNFILCVAVSVASVLPVVQEHQPHSGLLQASLISWYVMYLTWSAMSNTPDSTCKPDIFGSFSMIDAPRGNGTEMLVGMDDLSRRPSMDAASVFGLVIWFCCVIYSSVRSSSITQAARLTMSDKINLTEAEEGNHSNDENVRPPQRNEENDECEMVTYNWSLFHTMFALATLYAMMTLTNWYSPAGHNVISLATLSSNMGAVWVKIVSSWLCICIYSWTLLAPILLPNREFTF